MDDKLKWIIDHLDEFEQYLQAKRVMIASGISSWDDKTADLINEHLHNMAFTFLLLIMGEHIPHKLWCFDDYSELHEIIIGLPGDISNDVCDDGR